MSQCIVELLKIFEALQELLFFHCLFGFFLPNDEVHNCKTKPLLGIRKSNQKAQNSVISCSLSWSFWKLHLFRVWSREVLPHPGLERIQQPTSDFQTFDICRFSWTDARIAQVCSAIVHQIHIFPCLYLSWCLSIPLLLPQFEAVGASADFNTNPESWFLHLFFHLRLFGMIDWCLG